MNTEARSCQNCKNQFTIEPEDFQFYEKMSVPAPTWCPECRLTRRLAWRKERTFYRRQCDKCQKSIISVFSPESGLKIYCSPCWWSDDWDALDFGVDYKPEKPFLIQLRELLNKVPLMNLYGLYTTLENSDYTNMVAYLKNCYLVTYSDAGENLAYGSFVNRSKDSVDNLMIEECELCYEDVNCNKCFKTLFSVDCEGCLDVYFSKNCSGCENCFGCVNLRKKKYHIFNKPYSKEEYEKIIKDIYPRTPQKIEEALVESYALWKESPQKYIHGWRNAGSTGDYLNDCKNIKNSFVGFDMEDSRFCAFVTGKLTDAYDFTNFGLNSSLLYETLQAGNQISKVLFSWFAVTSCREVEYSMFTVNSSNIFGCVGLKKKQHCILNKQYSKEGYHKLREKIVKKMNQNLYKDSKQRLYPYGEFFPPELSPFSYNETSAQEFFPLTETEALNQGYNWRKLEEKNYQISKKHSDLPIQISEINDSIIDEVIGCAHEGKCNDRCTTAFKIIPQELQFYRRMNLPLPRLCPNCRHYSRVKLRNPFKLWHRQCLCAGQKSENEVYINTASHFHASNQCPNEFQTSYAPERPEIVYCEACYNAEVA